MKTNTHDLALELIQSTLDESFIDANDKLHNLMAIKAKESLDDLKESVASKLMDTIKNK